METTAIILAGGKSSRMGQDKGLVKLNNTSFISHVITAVKNAGINSIIIVANSTAYNQFGFPVYEDIYKEKGPLGGIYTGLMNSKTQHNIVLSCDIPFISPTLLTHLSNQELSKEIYFIEADKTHPLIGIYSKTLAPRIKEEILNNQLKVSSFIKKQNYQAINLASLFGEKAERIVVNINTQEELKKYRYEM